MEFSEAFTLKRRFISRQKRRTLADEQFPAAVTALEEYHNIEQQMAEPEVASDPDKMRSWDVVTLSWASSFPHTPHTSR